MPPARKAPARSAKAAKPAAPPANGNGHENAADVTREQYLDALWETRRDRADAIWSEHLKDNERLTGELLRRLTPLLHEPIPPRYIETIGAVQGKPYESTGIRSAQVQVDVMNQVVGADHWRFLPHWSPDGQLCRTHVVIGNDLQWCRLDEHGELVPYTLLQVDNPVMAIKEAEVLVHVQGYGGHARGSGKGDIWKGSETNALKRTLARVGPGAAVYRLDFEDDPRQPENKAARERMPDSPAKGQTGEVARVTPDASPGQALKDLLDAKDGADDDVKALRGEADKLLRTFSEDPESEAAVRSRLVRIAPCGKDKRKLQDLIDRANSTLDAQLDLGA